MFQKLFSWHEPQKLQIIYVYKYIETLYQSAFGLLLSFLIKEEEEKKNFGHNKGNFYE